MAWRLRGKPLTVARRESLLAASAAVAAGGVITGAAMRTRVVERRQRRARRYRLRDDETPADGVRRIARGQLGLTSELVANDPSAEDVHDARKTIKRVRALVRLSRDCIGKDRYQAENVALRDAGRSLSGARDAEVMLQTLADLERRFADEIREEPWPRLHAVLDGERDAAREEIDATQAAAALSEAELRVATWRLPEEGGPEALSPGFERIYRRGRQALRVAKEDTSSENLHELRKRAKDLWHGSQLMRPVCPKRLKKLGRRAHRLSDLLGDDHDLAVLRARAVAQPALFDDGELELLRGLIERRRVLLRHDALRCAARVYGAKPRKLLRKVSLA